MHQGGYTWSLQEKQEHINYLELLIASLALRCFAAKWQGVNILLCLDNITTIAFLNRMGGTHSQKLSDLIGGQYMDVVPGEGITIHAEHLPGRENIQQTGNHGTSQILVTGCSRERVF